MGGRDPMADKPDDEGETNRRKFERITVLWSGTLVSGVDVIDCLIVNVSPTGAMVRVDDPNRCKTPVVLRNQRFGELAGKISWRKGKELGIEFTESQDVVTRKLGKAIH